MHLSKLSLAAICLMLGTTSIAQATEIHAIGVYEGDQESLGGVEAYASVDRQEEDVILVLGSYEAVRWNIETSPNTTLTDIYIHGYNVVKTEVLLNGRKYNAKRIDLRSTHRDSGEAFRGLVQTLTKQFQTSEISSFQGSYYATPSPFSVDHVQDRPENEPNYLKAHVNFEAVPEGLRQYVHQQLSHSLPKMNEEPYVVPSGMRVISSLSDKDKDRQFLVVDQYGDKAILEVKPSGEINYVNHDPLPGLDDIHDVGNGPAPALIPLAVEDNLLLLRAQPQHYRGAYSYRTYLIDMDSGKTTLVGVRDVTGQ